MPRAHGCAGVANGRETLLHAFAVACRPRKRLTVSQWADANRILTGKSAQEQGPWRTDRTPYAREPMDTLSLHSPVRKTVVMAAIQMLKTELGLNWMGYIVDHAPGPTLSVQPTLELRDRYVLQRVNPMLEACAPIADRFRVKSQRDASNSRDLKDFPGGMLVFGGANSAASLSSMPIKNAIADEVDKFPSDLGGEGDPLGLLEGRQSNFSRSKLLVISSPTMKEGSLIESEYEGGDMRQYHLPCPHCSELIVLKWPQLQWTAFDGVVKEVWYVCEKCGSEIQEHEKTRMLAAGRWIAQKKNAPYRSYHIHALYSPLGMGRSWSDLVYQWLAAQSDPIKLKRFVNTRLAETWEDQSRKLKSNELSKRAEDDSFELGTIPPGCLAITMSIDTQDSWLEYKYLGWGEDDKYWVIGHGQIVGDTTDEHTWDQLEAQIHTTFTNSFGKTMKPVAVGIDSRGHRTEQVKEFVMRTTLKIRVYSLQGSTTRMGRAIAQTGSYPNKNHRGKVVRKGYCSWNVGTEHCKDFIYAHLAADAKRAIHERTFHFPLGLEEEYYNGLLAEVYDPEKNRYVQRLGAKYKRNEPLDLMVYAWAIGQHREVLIGRNRRGQKTAAYWTRLKALLEPDAEMKPVEPDGESGGEGSEDNKPHRKQPRRKRAGGWAKNW